MIWIQIWLFVMIWASHIQICIHAILIFLIYSNILFLMRVSFSWVWVSEYSYALQRLSHLLLSVTGFKWHKNTCLCFVLWHIPTEEKQTNKQKCPGNRQTNKQIRGHTLRKTKPGYIPQRVLLLGEWNESHSITEPLRPQLVAGYIYSSSGS